uniref:(northern house mosquito) hypothetical protein n=1 Tax=Culex pipiens TaxID=7175 RepID=A0A8D8HIL6_CULPI
MRHHLSRGHLLSRDASSVAKRSTTLLDATFCGLDRIAIFSRVLMIAALRSDFRFRLWLRFPSSSRVLAALQPVGHFLLRGLLGLQRFDLGLASINLLLQS